MSLYPQSTAYSQVAYPPQGYGAPAPPPNAYYPPPPAPQPVFQHFDPNTFRRDYATRLSNLTVNSRPIIQSLSMLAQEYTRFADVVVQCIEQHIRRVSPFPLVFALSPHSHGGYPCLGWTVELRSYICRQCIVVSGRSLSKDTAPGMQVPWTLGLCVVTADTQTLLTNCAAAIRTCPLFASLPLLC